VGRGWFFVGKKKHKEDVEIKEGESRVDYQVIN
jgi:hypothetical protein